MTLAISILLAVAPLVGLGVLLWNDPAVSVGNLFLTLMALTISGLFGMNVLMDLRQRGLLPGPLGRKAEPARAMAAAAGGGGTVVVMASGGVRERGVVEHVAYFESQVGRTNRCLVTLRNGKGPARLLVFKGDVRDQFPVGGKVEVIYREGEEGYDLLERKLA